MAGVVLVGPEHGLCKKQSQQNMAAKGLVACTPSTVRYSMPVCHQTQHYCRGKRSFSGLTRQFVRLMLLVLYSAKVLHNASNPVYGVSLQYRT